mgnify:CR=1 FL=1
MTKNILVFGASSSKASINKRFATFTANQLQDANIDLLDLNDFEMPIYSIDREKESGIHPLAEAFKEKIRNADGIIISFAEHNGSYSAAYKNIYDWVSRIEKDVWLNKPMHLMATSPGGRGGQFVLETATKGYKFANSNSISTFSLPSFMQNFSDEDGIKDEALKTEFEAQLAIFKMAVWG